jgi:hypothetical protein
MAMHQSLALGANDGVVIVADLGLVLAQIWKAKIVCNSCSASMMDTEPIIDFSSIWQIVDCSVAISQWHLVG